MNYPKPDILAPHEGQAPTYLYVPEYRFDIIGKPNHIDFLKENSEHQGFDSFLSFEPFYDNREYAEPSEPIEILIRNTSDHIRECEILNSYRNKLIQNYSNPQGIEIMTSANSMTSYFDVLMKSEARDIEIGRIDVHVIDKPDNIRHSQVMSQLSLKHIGTDPFGSTFTAYINTIYSPTQFDNSIIESNIPRGKIRIKGSTGFSAVLMPRTTIMLKFWPASQRTLTSSEILHRREEKRDAKIEARIEKAFARAEAKRNR